MKIKCIENDGWEYSLTIGKTYEVVSIYDKGYRIIDDNGHESGCYYKSYFKTSSEIRNEIINKLLEDEN